MSFKKQIMVETLSVSFSGPAFSLLLYENVRTKYDQEGFLLGEILEKKTNTITDNDEQVTKIDRVVKVNSAIPCPKLGYFYDAAGRIDEKRITSFLGNQKLNQVKVVAWYKFKHSNAFKITLREKIVHKQLSQYFAPSQPELFTCCLLTNSSHNNSTHLYSQTFLRYIEPTYQTLPMHIINLSDPNNLYKSIDPSSDMFNNLVKSLHIDKRKTQGINVITQIIEELQKRTEQVVTKLAEKEKTFFDLQEEVEILKEKLKNKEAENVNAIDTDMSNDLKVVENGNGDDILNINSTNSKEESPERTKDSRSRKKTVRAAATRNSSRSPVKVDLNVDNTINNRTRNRTITTGQKKKNLNN